MKIIEKTILENMSEGVYVRDLEMNLIYINPAAEKLTGYSIREALGKKCYDIFGDENLACKEVCPVNKAISEGLSIFHHEGKIKTRKGDVRDIRVSISPIIDEGQVVAAVVIMQDMTWMRKSEETHVKTLIALEQERSMFFDGPVVVFKWKNKEGWPVEYVSGNSEKVTGYSQDEWVKDQIKYTDLIAKEDLDRVIKERKYYRESGVERFQYEPYRLVKKDGSEIWVSDYTTIIRDQSGAVKHSLGYIIDITEHVLAERFLKESQERFRLLFYHIPIMIHSINPEGLLLEVNDHWLMRLGYTREEVIGRPSVDFMSPETRKFVQEKIQPEFFRTGKFDRVPMQLVTKKGRVIETLVSARGGYNDLGKVAYSLAVFEDITERLRAEEAIRDSERNLAKAQQIAHIGNWNWDIEADRVSWSDELYRILGLAPQEFDATYESYLQCIHPDDLEIFQNNTETALVEKTPYSFEYRIIRPDSDIRVVHAQGKVNLDAEGNPTGLFGTIQDITESKLVEDKIKASLKEKEVLLREIHHRVKNNLAVIDSLLNMKSSQIQDERISEVLGDSRNRIKTMAMIHETLYSTDNLSRIDLGIYTKNLGRNLLRAMRQKAGQVRMSYDIGEIQLDIDRAIPIGLVLNELITNSLKYAFPEGNGEIKVAAHGTDDGYIELIVHDNGVGLPGNVDLNNPVSFGLRLVSILARDQLEGTLCIQNDGGARISIRWPAAVNDKKEVTVA